MIKKFKSKLKFSEGQTLIETLVGIFILITGIAAAVGLAILLSIYRNQKTIYTDEIDILKW